MTNPDEKDVDQIMERSKPVYASFKMCLFGDGGVGKTTLVNRFITGKFNEDFKMTIGVDFYSKTFSVDNQTVSLKIWDFAGQNQNQFRNLLPNYISGAAGGIFMYDITRFASIKNISEWLSILKKGLGSDDIAIPILMVGGKSDLQERRSVERDYGLEVSKENNLSDFYECSSITGQNIEVIFISIARRMMEKSKTI